MTHRYVEVDELDVACCGHE